MLVLEHAGFGPAHIGVWNALQRERQGLDDEIVDRKLVRGLAILVHRRGAIDLLARLQKFAYVAIDGEIEMRNRLYRCSEPRGDGAAHTVMRHELVAAVLVKRADLLIGYRRRDHGSGTAGRSGRRRAQAAAFARGRDIAGDHAAMRSRTLDTADFDAHLFGEPARKRRCENVPIRPP